MLGSPVAHSLSPVLHRAAYAHLGLDWAYDAVEVGEAGLPGFLDGLGPQWRGLSLTMPLKWAVLPLLDEVDRVAAAVGTVNTVLLDSSGPARRSRPRRRGANTDVPGAAAALAEAVGTGPAPRSAVLLGAGATACSVLAALHPATSVAVLARDPARAGRLLGVADGLGRRVTVHRFGDAAPARPELLVSTVPGGALDAAAITALEPVLPGPGGIVFDVVYAGWPTPLARSAAAAGARLVSGLDLLVHQAVGQVALMTGRAVPPAVLRRGLADAEP